jgi:predicted metal-binding membrane protein
MNTPRPDVASRGLIVTAVLVFAASAAGTAVWCGSMATMPGMEMPGGWSMTMAWMRMPAQSWWDAAATFVAMWALMMVAMMMPVLAPELRGMRATAALVFALGYFGVWILLGMAIFPFGVAFAELAMRSTWVSRATPWLAAFTVLAAGGLQFARWKARLLRCCHREEGCCGGLATAMALRAGARLGLRCVYCCASLTAVLLVIGVMDLLAMALVTIAISAERLMRAGGATPRAIGVALLGVGSVFLMRAMFI